MEQIRPLTSLSHDKLIARIEQYIVVVELRDAEIRELHAANSALLAERDALIHDNAEYVGAASALATENQRLREALRWAAGSLLAVCGDGQATELDRFTLDGVTRTGTEILDMADAALAQGQEEV